MNRLMKHALLIAPAFVIGVIGVAALFLPPTADTQADQTGHPRADYDTRAGLFRTLAAPPATISAEQRIAPNEEAPPRPVVQAKLRRARPSLQLKWSTLTNAPSRWWSFTEPLTPPSDDDPELIARRFLADNEDLLKLSAADIAALRVAHRRRTAHNGVTHVTLQQYLDDLEVFQADFVVHVTRAGEVLAASGELLPDAARAVKPARPKLTAVAALRIAALELEVELAAQLNSRTPPQGVERRQLFAQAGEPAAGFDRDVEVRLVYFPLAADEVRLAWEFVLWMKRTPDVYLTLIDAENGALLYRQNFTHYDENPLRPHGAVFTNDSPRPDSPHVNDQPPIVARADVPFRPTPFNGREIFAVDDPHYDWWAGRAGDALVGNNTDTRLDRDANNLPDQPRLTAPGGNFTFPLDFTRAPTAPDNQRAAQVNLFHWLNRYHDILYSFGFDEAAGNFQTDNFELGGRGNDAVNADAQDGLGVNNANFSAPPDGTPGRVQMYLWTTANPPLDGDFDQQVIMHELTHGVTQRLVFNSSGLTGLQAGGMGEGWSDWFSLALLRRDGDDPAGAYPVGGYVFNDYARGIRRFPYSTKPETFPLTFKDIALNPAVHRVGEIWCNALWEMRAELIGRYGFQAGQRLSIQLVVDGLKLTPRAPTFVDARNAILLADRVNNGGANQCLLWRAFAKRGLGFAAAATDSNDGAPDEAREIAPYCSDAGVLSLDRSDYLPSETARINLGDRNATGALTLTVASTVTGDRETLRPMPDAAVAGNYQTTVRLTSARAPKPGDGVLQGSADAGDRIVVTYHDANNGGNQPVEIKSEAGFAREAAAFEDTIEAGNQGWLPTGAWGITNTRSASPIRCWTDSPAGNASGGGNTTLTSPPLDLTGYREVALNFAQSHALQANADFGVVEFSLDDGATWARAAVFTGNQPTFAPVRLRLRKFDNHPRARLRFRLQMLTPNNDGWYIDDIRVTGRSGDARVISPNNARPPALASLTPAFGPPTGGPRVTLLGSGFTESDDTSVSFDGVAAAAVNVVSGSVITANAPAHAAGAVTVRVSNRRGGSSLAGGFTYYALGSAAAAPTLTRIFPDFGSIAGGTMVTLFGANFTPETAVAFGARTIRQTFINARTLRVVTPPLEAPRRVEVTAANGTATARLADGFNYISPTPPRVAVNRPGAGEAVLLDAPFVIGWSSADNRAVARHRLSLYGDPPPGAPVPVPRFIADIARDVPGEAQSLVWTPARTLTLGNARIRVLATDDEGTETEVYSQPFQLARRWEAQPLVPAPLNRHMTATDGRNLYVIGGLSNTGTQSRVLRLDVSAAATQWVAAAPLPAGLHSGAAVALNGKFYVPGGVNAQNQVTGQHYVYDPATDAWTTAAAPPAAHYFYAAVADEARGVYYVLGGSTEISGPTPTAAVRAYDPATNAWTELPPMTNARTAHEATLIDGRLYVVGGYGATDFPTAGEVYDFTPRRWSPLASLRTPRAFAVNFVTRDAAGNSRWFVANGADPTTGFLLGVEVYDVRNDRWLTLDNSFAPPVPRIYAAGVTLNNFFHLTGGQPPGLGTPAHDRLRLDTLTLNPLNQAPALAVPPPQTAVAGVELKFTVTANDQGSGVPLTLAAMGLPPDARFIAEARNNNSARGTFAWTPPSADAGRTFAVSFTVGDGQALETKQVVLRVVEATPLVAVNAADFRAGPIAPDSIAALFGANLAVRAETAVADWLPFELAGASVTVNGAPAALFFVSPTQINFAVPPGVEPGRATIIVHNGVGGYAAGTVEIAAVAPALFTRNGGGTGDAAAVATVDGVNFQPPPFDVLVNGRPNILLLFGTGARRAPAANPFDENGVAEAVTASIDGKSARVLFAGPQGAFNGLDQCNVELPASLAGTGPRRVEVALSVNGVAANRVSIQLK